MFVLNWFNKPSSPSVDEGLVTQSLKLRDGKCLPGLLQSIPPASLSPTPHRGQCQIIPFCTYPIVLSNPTNVPSDGTMPLAFLLNCIVPLWGLLLFVTLLTWPPVHSAVWALCSCFLLYAGSWLFGFINSSALARSCLSLRSVRFYL